MLLSALSISSSETLQGHEFGVATVESHELGVGAALDNAAVVEDGDAVGTDDGGEAVGDDHGGASTEEVVEGGLKEALALGVEGGGGLVEDEEVRVAK